MTKQEALKLFASHVDVLEERARGGQRPGMRKVYTQDIGSGTPVVKMTQITTVEL